MGKFNVTNEERLWAMLAHLLTFLGYVVLLGAFIPPLVIYLVYKDKSQFVAFHALQSLLFQLVLFVVGVILSLSILIAFLFSCFILPLLWIPLGIILLIVIAIVAFIYPIIAAIRAHNGELFEYWLVGGWAREIVGI